ncbi:MAG TPA: hypothetical protein P5556_06380 [Candidatus Gastranaerophilales bacterium]|nr:hypothetical protein [Candidatus Gastranaerophilales bacterium]
MDKYFPESETLSVKRLKVAIEKKNWELLEKGLEKAWQVKRSGQKFQRPDLWKNLLMWTEAENVPPELWEKLNEFVDHLAESVLSGKQQTLAIIEEYSNETFNLIDKDVTIVHNQFFDKNVWAKVRKHRINFNNIAHLSNKHNLDAKWMDELAELAADFNEPEEELKGFISLVSLFKRNGSIITNSPSCNIYKMLVKSDINAIYSGIKSDINKSGKIWEIFHLGGSINSFICAGCANRLVKAEYTSSSLVESCNKCKSPMYPDISCTGDSYSEIQPQTWYNAYDRLINSRVWILMSPPSHNDQIPLRNMLLDAVKNSVVEEIHIITNKFEVYELWKSKFLSFGKKVEIKNNHSNIVALLETYNEASLSSGQFNSKN